MAKDALAKGEPTATVLAIGQMGFDGHIIPHTWYDHITYKTEKGTEKVDLQAIVILSDIVYWHRPKKIMDEATGRLLRLERRFSADKLQRNYQQIAKLFGLSKTQAARAVKRLRDHGLITMEFRTVETARGPLFNVLYLDLVPERLAEITYRRVKTTSQICKDPPAKTETPTVKKVDTYTEITPENTSDTNTESPAATELAIPSTFQEWLDIFRDPATNKPAALRQMYQKLYPEHPPPDYGYCGKVARRVGGYEVLAMRLWELSTRAPVGDVLAYVQGMKKAGKGNGRGARNKATVQSWMEGWDTEPAIEASYTVTEVL